MTDCKRGAQGNEQEYNEKGQFSGPLCHGDQTPTPTAPPKMDLAHWTGNTPDMPPLIKARKDYLDAINRGKWQEFSRAIDKLPNVTESEKFRYMMIFGVEGMMKVDKDGTTSGIQPATYWDNVEEGNFTPDPGHTVNNPEDLNIEERARYYRAFFQDKLFRFGGYGSLESMGDMETAAAVADVVFQYSPRGADTVFRKALGDMDAKPMEKNQISYNTWNKLISKAEDPNERIELRKKIAQARERYSPGPEKRGNVFYGQDRYKMFVHYWE